jgi:hypothetical protein
MPLRRPFVRRPTGDNLRFCHPAFTFCPPCCDRRFTVESGRPRDAWWLAPQTSHNGERMEGRDERYLNVARQIRGRLSEPVRAALERRGRCFKDGDDRLPEPRRRSSRSARVQLGQDALDQHRKRIRLHPRAIAGVI